VCIIGYLPRVGIAHQLAHKNWVAPPRDSTEISFTTGPASAAAPTKNNIPFCSPDCWLLGVTSDRQVTLLARKVVLRQGLLSVKHQFPIAF
jgi:hypothetical protein